jgi:hypothetical protein
MNAPSQVEEKAAGEEVLSQVTETKTDANTNGNP